jgi:tRNA-dihydrouridine synthase
LFGPARFPRVRKHLGWYCKGFPHAAALRAEMVRACSSADVERALAGYLSSAGERPEPVPCS